MPRAKRIIQGATTVDGFELVWRLHREQQLSTDGWQGIAIHVKVAEGVRKELHLEYPAECSANGYMRPDPVRHPILAAKVEDHIRLAMADGWDPASRGKPYRFEVDELPS